MAGVYSVKSLLTNSEPDFIMTSICAIVQTVLVICLASFQAHLQNTGTYLDAPLNKERLFLCRDSTSRLSGFKFGVPRSSATSLQAGAFVNERSQRGQPTDLMRGECPARFQAAKEPSLGERPLDDGSGMVVFPPAYDSFIPKVCEMLLNSVRAFYAPI
jgi:hypothetical protein